MFGPSPQQASAGVSSSITEKTITVDVVPLEILAGNRLNGVDRYGRRSGGRLALQRTGLGQLLRSRVQGRAECLAKLRLRARTEPWGRGRRRLGPTGIDKRNVHGTTPALGHARRCKDKRKDRRGAQGESRQRGPYLGAARHFATIYC